MYPYFEAIRVENREVQNLSFHQERVSLNSTITLSDIVKKLQFPAEGLHKLRISYDESSAGEISIIDYVSKPIKSLKIVVCNTIDYSVKRNDRSCINDLFSQRGCFDDVLIIKNNMVSDTSYCNIIFFDGTSWHTPDTCLLKGTCRERLIKLGLIQETKISINDIQNYQSFMLINSMLDFNEARSVPITNIF